MSAYAASTREPNPERQAPHMLSPTVAADGFGGASAAKRHYLIIGHYSVKM